MNPTAGSYDASQRWALKLAFEELHFFSDHFEVLGVYPADPFRRKS